MLIQKFKFYKIYKNIKILIKYQNLINNLIIIYNIQIQLKILTNLKQKNTLVISILKSNLK